MSASSTKGANLLLSKVDVSWWRYRWKNVKYQNKVFDLTSRLLSGATEFVLWIQTLHIEDKPMIMIIKFQWILLLKKVGFNYIFYKFVELYYWFTCHVLNTTYLRNTKKRDGPKYEKWMVIEISLVEFSIWWWSRNSGMSKIVERTWIWVGEN